MSLTLWTPWWKVVCRSVAMRSRNVLISTLKRSRYFRQTAIRSELGIQCPGYPLTVDVTVP